MRLEKEQSRERMRQLRALWNEWDPIGVMPVVTDEYSTYAGQSMRYLEAGDTKQLVEYLRWVVLEHMDLPREPATSFEQFAKTMQQWFSEKWANSRA